MVTILVRAGRNDFYNNRIAGIRFITFLAKFEGPLVTEAIGPSSPASPSGMTCQVVRRRETKPSNGGLSNGENDFRHIRCPIAAAGYRAGEIVNEKQAKPADLHLLQFRFGVR